MTEVLVKLRDFGERRCAPALQRLFLVVDELVGWAKMCVASLSLYKSFYQY